MISWRLNVRDSNTLQSLSIRKRRTSLSKIIYRKFSGSQTRTLPHPPFESKKIKIKKKRLEHCPKNELRMFFLIFCNIESTIQRMKYRNANTFSEWNIFSAFILFFCSYFFFPSSSSSPPPKTPTFEFQSGEKYKIRNFIQDRNARRHMSAANRFKIDICGTRSTGSIEKVACDWAFRMRREFGNT